MEIQLNEASIKEQLSKLNNSAHTRDREDINSKVKTRNGIFLFDKKEVSAAIDRENRSERKKLLNELLDEDNFKPYAKIHSGVFSSLEHLRKLYPNFSEVIDLCIARLTLSQLAAPKAICLPPILLTGPPGVGKTRFLKELAKKLGTEFYSLDLSSVSSGFILNGAASTWAESKPGFISDSLRKSAVANPIMLLDEIDKVSSGLQYHPLACLYALLEDHSANSFRDEYVEVEMNMSKIIWFTTANYPERIEPPLRSRMTEIEIAPPSPSQNRQITKNIYSELLTSNPWGKYFSPELTADVIELLCHFPPRQVKKEIEKGLAKAAKRVKRNRSTINVLPSDLQHRTIGRTQCKGIGFLANI